MSNNQHPIHCICGNNHKGSCPNCSRIKMSICLHNGWDHLKLTNTNGNLTNPVWYNFYKHNRQPSEKIVKKMIARLLKNPTYKHAANVLMFFENNNPIAKYKL